MGMLRAWLRPGFVRALGLTATIVFAQGGCNEIDTTREAGPRATLGDDMYGAMCDRLGAAVLSEDLVGASYHGICHYDASGAYGDGVDEGILPAPPDAKSQAARALSIAKMQAMAKHRAALVRAFNAAFPDVKVPDLTTQDPNDTVRLHQALLVFTQELTKLYDTNPYDANAPPLMPMNTRALGNLFGKIEASDAARQALARIAGRHGYRPFNVGMGAIRTMLGYPELRSFVKAQLAVLGPGGAAVPELQQLLTVAKRELLTSTCELCQKPPFSLGAGATPNRPRYAIEVLQRLLLDENDAYIGQGEGSRFITRRDARGFAIPLGNKPGVPGTVPKPFADGNNDGFADVDQGGRFVDAGGAPLAIDTPFAVPGKPYGAADEFGRSTAKLYDYLDTTRTLVGALSRDLVALLDPTAYAGGAADPWTQEHEAVMYALAGMHVLAGERAPALYDHEHDAILDGGAACPSQTPCTPYQRFKAEDSPLPDLVQGLGQVIADPDSDAILIALDTLVRDHEDVVARLMDSALKIKAIADKHDGLAAKGKWPKAELAYETPVWEQVAQIVNDMTKHPGLVRKLVLALSDDIILTAAPQDAKIQEPPAQHLGETLSAFMTMRDRYNYNPNDINGPALNVTDGGQSIANPHNPVDYGQPLREPNRSLFEASSQLIFDATRVKACNKKGAKLHSKLGNLTLTYPPFGSGYDECDLFVFPNMGAFYLDSLLPSSHPKHAFLQVKASDLNTILNLLGSFASPDKLLESSSGITGLTLHPSAPALNRLLFFGASSQLYPGMPDDDAINKGGTTDLFISMSMEPTSGPQCPLDALGVAQCPSKKDVLRVRDHAVIFGWERLGFMQYLQPQMQAFAELGCNASVTQCSLADYTGENMFLDLVSTLWRHWPDMNHGDYCDHNASPDNPRYCSGAGIDHYEPILGEAFLGDIIPALHDFAKVASQVDVTVERGPNKGKKVNGTQIVEMLVKILFDQEYAAKMGVTDRAGKAATKWVDGTPQAQITTYDLFADALHGMDQRFAKSSLSDAASRKARWRRARSLLVDQFLQVEGSGKNAHFVNRSVPKALLATLAILREQVNAHCPNRETDGKCDWARKELAKKFQTTLSGPTFAAIADVSDKLNQDDAARRSLEKFASYALTSQSGGDALQGMLASLGDLMQLLRADGDFAPIFNAVAVAANPKNDAEGPGCADRTVEVLHAMSGDSYDRYHVLDQVLPALVTPMDGGKGLTPIEVILDAVADIHRVDAAKDTPLDEQDYKYVMQTVREFFTNPYRGFEQLYFIVQNRPQ